MPFIFLAENFLGFEEKQANKKQMFEARDWPVSKGGGSH
jgi:hypothetical protein